MSSSSSVIYSRIARTPKTVYLVGLTKSISSYTLHVSALSASTGELLSDAHIPSSIHNGLTDFLVLSDTADDESSPFVAWLEKDALKFVRLTEKLDSKPKTLKGSSFKGISNIGLNERGWFVALEQDGTGMVLGTDKDSQGLKQIWKFAESATSDQYSESVYAGGLDKDNKPYVGRVFWSHYYKVRVYPVRLSRNLIDVREDGLRAHIRSSSREWHRLDARLHLPLRNI